MASSSSPKLVMLLCLLALISLHLRPAKAHGDNHDVRMEKAASAAAARSLNMTFIPMPNGTIAPLMTGIKWSCPCNGPYGLRCGCDITGCGCNNMPIVQPPFECPGDSNCGCDLSGCSCSPPPDYGCPSGVAFCEYYRNNFYCQIPGLRNVSSIDGGSSEAEDELN